MLRWLYHRVHALLLDGLELILALHGNLVLARLLVGSESRSRLRLLARDHAFEHSDFSDLRLLRDRDVIDTELLSDARWQRVVSRLEVKQLVSFEIDRRWLVLSIDL